MDQLEHEEPSHLRIMLGTHTLMMSAGDVNASEFPKEHQCQFPACQAKAEFTAKP